MCLINVGQRSLYLSHCCSDNRVRTRFHAIAVGAVVLAALAACGGSGQVPSKGAVKIGVDLPEALPEGAATLNGVRFAVQRAGGSVGGWALVIDHRDDTRQGSPNADAGVENLQKMLGNGDVGMIGPYTSSVAKAEIPIAAAQHFAMISPSATQPCLTRDESFCRPRPQEVRGGNPNNFFRLVTTNLEQARAMADYFHDTLGLRKVAVLDDSATTGVTMADTFEAEFKRLGGNVVARSEYRYELTLDWKPILSDFERAGAQAVYASGFDFQNICIPRRQMQDIGWEVPFGGADSIGTSDCIDQAQDQAVGMLSTTAAPDAMQIPAAQSTIRAFKASFKRIDDYGAYTMLAYDATGILIQAITKALDDGHSPRDVAQFREAVRANVAATTGYVGVIGTTSFDQNGDTSLRIVSIYQVRSVDISRANTDHLVCGSRLTRLCFVWLTQLNLARP
jgi:branched-chain amino acid transport system substrate-binding protein